MLSSIVCGLIVAILSMFTIELPLKSGFSLSLTLGGIVNMFGIINSMVEAGLTGGS